jgi:predicted RNA methylase
MSPLETPSSKQIDKFHRYSIEKAIREGKPVPSEVLKDYPDLASKQETFPPAEQASPQPAPDSGQSGKREAGGAIEENDTPPVKLGKRLRELLETDQHPRNNQEFLALAREAWKGSGEEMQPSQAYDAMETAINAYVKDHPQLYQPGDDPRAAIERLSKLLQSIPKQTSRSGEKEAFQQFSTPPHYAALAGWVANIKPGEEVLEPSAGTGDLAVQGMLAGGNVTVNEISADRARLLDLLAPKQILTEDAEQLGNILAGKYKPSVVLMNPPFSRAGSRMGEKKIIGTDRKHVDAALSLLAPNGRLVAIMGAPLHAEEKGETKGMGDWIRELKKKYNVRANVLIDRNVYGAYGTTFPTRLLIVDKTGPTQSDAGIVRKGWDTPLTLDQAVEALQGIRNDRSTQVSGIVPAAETSPSQSGSGVRAGKPASTSASVGTERGPEGVRPDSGVGGRPTGNLGGNVSAFQNPEPKSGSTTSADVSKLGGRPANGNTPLSARGSTCPA